MPEKRIRKRIDVHCIVCGSIFSTKKKKFPAKACSKLCSRKTVDNRSLTTRENMSIEEINALPDGACGMKLNNGSICILDPDDFDMVSSMRWVCIKGYPYRRFEWITGSKQNHALHQIILDIPRGMVCDHINGNPLDNRRSNLRICTANQNFLNKRLYSNNTSGFKGVHFKKRDGVFVAYINKDGKRINIGSFKDAKSAAEAYNKAALALHGEFARLNKLNPTTP